MAKEMNAICNAEPLRHFAAVIQFGSINVARIPHDCRMHRQLLVFQLCNRLDQDRHALARRQTADEQEKAFVRELKVLAQMRVGASAELFPAMASGYRAEIEKMQREVFDYLTRHASQPLPAA